MASAAVDWSIVQANTSRAAHRRSTSQPPKNAAVLSQRTRRRDRNLQLATPYSNKARRVIAQQVAKITNARTELDRAITRTLGPHRERQQHLAATRGLHVLLLLRARLTKRSDALARREKKVAQSINAALLERQRLYEMEATPERAADVKMVKSLKRKFEQRSDPSPADCDQSRRSCPYDAQVHEAPSPGSSVGSDDAGSRGNQAQDAVAVSNPALESEIDNSHSDNTPASARKDTSGKNEKHSPDHGLDGSFDDFDKSLSSSNKSSSSKKSTSSNKRKRADNGPDGAEAEAPRKKAKKERAGPKKRQREAAASPERQSDTPRASAQKKCKTEEAEDEMSTVGRSMSQPKQPSSSSIAKYEEPDQKDAHQPAHDPAEDQPAAPNASAAEPPEEEPWYKAHARAMLDPDFDDCVYEVPHKRRVPHNNRNQYLMSGALPASPRDESARSPLPTPPSSDGSAKGGGGGGGGASASARKKRRLNGSKAKQVVQAGQSKKRSGSAGGIS